MDSKSLTRLATMSAMAVLGVMGTAVATESAAVSVPAQFQGDWRVSLTEVPTGNHRPTGPALRWRARSSGINANRIRALKAAASRR
jgi:hypothetical protein